MSGVQRVKKIPVTRKQTVWIPIKILSPDYYNFLMIFFFRKGRVSGKNLVCWNKNVEVTFHLLYNSVQFSCYKKKKKWRGREFYYFYWNDLKFRISNHAYCTFARNKIVESKGKKEKRSRYTLRRKPSSLIPRKRKRNGIPFRSFVSFSCRT